MEIISLLNNQTETSSHQEQFAIDVLMALSSTPKSLSSKYFYDDVGSDLFQKITQHEDYYPTKTEFSILDQIKNELPALLNEKAIDIIELGAGDGHKTSLLLNGFLAAGCEVNYYPIDISELAMQQLGENMQGHDNLRIKGVVAEYHRGLRYVRDHSKNKALVLFLGSNIGNFDRIQSQGFLRRIWQSMEPGDYALIGFDLKKCVNVLTRAYNDSAGYTRDFNLNILQRMNNELGANFDLEKFDHYGVYNPVLGAMESYLLSLEAQTVYIEKLRHSFEFAAFEPLHLEFSFKYLESDIEYLSERTGFEVMQNFTDDQHRFMNSLWKVSKQGTNTEGAE